MNGERGSHFNTVGGDTTNPKRLQLTINDNLMQPLQHNKTLIESMHHSSHADIRLISVSANMVVKIYYRPTSSPAKDSEALLATFCWKLPFFFNLLTPILKSVILQYVSGLLVLLCSMKRAQFDKTFTDKTSQKHLQQSLLLTHSLLALSRRCPSQSPVESVGENRLGAPPSQLHLFVVCEAQRGGQRSNKFTGTPGLSHVNAAGTGARKRAGVVRTSSAVC